MNLCEIHNLDVEIAAAAQPSSPDSKLLDGSITSIYDTEAVTLRDRACQDCTALADATFTNLTAITTDSTFEGCTALVQFSAPNLTSISGDYTFRGDTHLTSVSLPNIVTLDAAGTFYDCSSLESLSMQNLTCLNDRYTGNESTSRNTFTGGVSLTRLNLPKCSTLYLGSGNITHLALGATACYVHTSTYGTGVVYSSLESLDLTGVEALYSIENDNGAFKGCTGLRTITAPNLRIIGNGVKGNASETNTSNGVFTGCTALTSVAFTAIETVGSYAFRGCTLLSSIQLGSPGHAVASIGANAFQNVPSDCSITVYTANGQPLTNSASAYGWGGNALTDINWQPAYPQQS